MRVIPIEMVKPGMKLAKALFRDEDGRVLLRSNVELKPSYIQRIIDLKYTYVYVYDSGEVEPDINEIEPISEEVLFKARLLVQKIFKLLKQDAMVDVGHTRKIIAEMVNQVFANPEIIYNLVDTRSLQSYVYAHCVNVCVISLMIGLVMGLNRREMETLGVGALLHDVGKTLINTELLNKPAELNAKEFEVIRKHARDGYELLKKKANINFLSAHVALQHHEREDGSGYPRGLTGHRIHRFSKIVAVADTYDAMTSHGLHRKGMLANNALKAIKAEAGQKYDQAVVEAFLKVMAPYPLGSTLLLNNGETTVAVKVTRRECLVKVMAGGEEGALHDLYLDQQLTVVKSSN